MSFFVDYVFDLRNFLGMFLAALTSHMRSFLFFILFLIFLN